MDIYVLVGWTPSVITFSDVKSLRTVFYEQITRECLPMTQHLLWTELWETGVTRVHGMGVMLKKQRAIYDGAGKVEIHAIVGSASHAPKVLSVESIFECAAEINKKLYR